MNVIFWLIFVLTNTVIQAVPVNMYVIYTPSHQSLYEQFFLPSFKALGDDEINLVVKNIEQTCKTACYKQAGWKDTTLQKVEMIIDAIYKTWNYYFIYSDVDVQFFGPIKKEIETVLQQYDLVVQKDHPNGTLCSGFFACKSNEKTLKLWQDVYKTMCEKEKYSDQGALNYCLVKQKNPYNIRWTYLPKTYFGGATKTGHSWYPGQYVPVPQKPKMHHANWTVGLENKKKQLGLVRKLVYYAKK
ncbi:hypothetical protein EKK58_06650 [Candidatus Dependentiae bacterium]|nr:MAG: hypothetical protein EKK58_06650 [Candidatus Dependentiae bacterium]